MGNQRFSVVPLVKRPVRIVAPPPPPPRDRVPPRPPAPPPRQFVAPKEPVPAATLKRELKVPVIAGAQCKMKDKKVCLDVAACGVIDAYVDGFAQTGTSDSGKSQEWNGKTNTDDKVIISDDVEKDFMTITNGLTSKYPDAPWKLERDKPASQYSNAPWKLDRFKPDSQTSTTLVTQGKPLLQRQETFAQVESGNVDVPKSRARASEVPTVALKQKCKKARRYGKDGGDGCSEVTVRYAATSGVVTKLKLKTDMTVKEFYETVLLKTTCCFRILCSTPPGFVDMVMDSKKTMFEVGLGRETDIKIVLLSAFPKEPCPACRCIESESNGTFEKLCEANLYRNRCPNQGWNFDEKDMSATAGFWRKPGKLWSAWDPNQIHQLTLEKWMNVAPSMFATIISNADCAEWKSFDRNVAEHLKTGRLEFVYWRGDSKKNALFSISCPKCQYFFHTRVGKGTDDAMVRLLLASWFEHEPSSFNLKPNELGRHNKITFSHHSLPPSTSTGQSQDTASTSATVATEAPTLSDVGTDPGSPLPEPRCALWAPALNFPPFESPRLLEQSEQSDVPNLSKLTVQD